MEKEISSERRRDSVSLVRKTFVSDGLRVEVEKRSSSQKNWRERNRTVASHNSQNKHFSLWVKLDQQECWLGKEAFYCVNKGFHSIPSSHFSFLSSFFAKNKLTNQFTQ